jgi:hypothetical protein
LLEAGVNFGWPHGLRATVFTQALIARFTVCGLESCALATPEIGFGARVGFGF